MRSIAIADREKLLSFFDNILIPYVVGDLNVMKRTELQSNGLGGCAIPIAMTVISTMELLGFLISDSANIGDSQKNITAIICNSIYFDVEYCQQVRKIAVDYRHSMMHSFFPSKKTLPLTPGVKRSKSNQLIEIDYVNSVRYESINVDRMANDLIEAISRLRRDVADHNNTVLISNISRGLKIIDLNLLEETTTTTTMSPTQMLNKK